MSEYIVDVSKIEHVPQISKEAAYAMLFGECGVPLYERIVRCRDCKHEGTSRFIEVGLHKYRSIDCTVVNPNGFCAWGEQKVVR